MSAGKAKGWKKLQTGWCTRPTRAKKRYIKLKYVVDYFGLDKKTFYRNKQRKTSLVRPVYEYHWHTMEKEDLKRLETKREKHLNSKEKKIKRRKMNCDRRGG